ncbi:MAG: hypothetical protein H6696_21250 [Deferribacteres bacterium]|nr:hypothetical protein [Deferribacteres bacterium]
MNERIQVLARSRNGKVEPIQFLFKNQLFTINTVLDYQEEAFHGNMQYYLTVNLIPSGCCKLHFDLRSGQWTFLEGNLPS